MVSRRARRHRRYPSPPSSIVVDTPEPGLQLTLLRALALFEKLERKLVQLSSAFHASIVLANLSCARWLSVRHLFLLGNVSGGGHIYHCGDGPPAARSAIIVNTVKCHTLVSLPAVLFHQ